MFSVWDDVLGKIDKHHISGQLSIFADRNKNFLYPIKNIKS